MKPVGVNMATTEPTKRTVFTIILAVSVLVNWVSLELAVPGPVGPDSGYSLSRALGTAIAIALVSLAFHAWKSVVAAYICAGVLNLMMLVQRANDSDELNIAQLVVGFVILVLILYLILAPLVRMVRAWLHRGRPKA